MPSNYVISHRPSVQQRFLTCHARSFSSRRGTLSAFSAAVLLDTVASLPAQAANDAVLQKLERLKREEGSEEVASPGLSRLSRLEVFHPSLQIVMSRT